MPCMNIYNGWFINIEAANIEQKSNYHSKLRFSYQLCFNINRPPIIWIQWWTANFILHKFHTVKNWYQFLAARKYWYQYVFTFRTNISHFVKNTHEVKFHIASMHTPQIDKLPPNSAAFCIRFQFFAVLSLTSVTIKYQFWIRVMIWYQFFTGVRILYQVFTCVRI